MIFLIDIGGVYNYFHLLLDALTLKYRLDNFRRLTLKVSLRVEIRIPRDKFWITTNSAPLKICCLGIKNITFHPWRACWCPWKLCRTSIFFLQWLLELSPRPAAHFMPFQFGNYLEAWTHSSNSKNYRDYHQLSWFSAPWGTVTIITDDLVIGCHNFCSILCEAVFGWQNSTYYCDTLSNNTSYHNWLLVSHAQKDRFCNWLTFRTFSIQASSNAFEYLGIHETSPLYPLSQSIQCILPALDPIYWSIYSQYPVQAQSLRPRSCAISEGGGLSFSWRKN